MWSRASVQLLGFAMEITMKTPTTRPPPLDPYEVNEEPELASEESVPLDGPDPEGERMIQELGQEKRRRQAEQDPQRPADPADGEPLPEQFPAS